MAKTYSEQLIERLANLIVYTDEGYLKLDTSEFGEYQDLLIEIQEYSGD